MCILYNRDGKAINLRTFAHGDSVQYLGRDLRTVCEKHTVLGPDPAKLAEAADKAIDGYLLGGPIIIDGCLYYLGRAGLGSSSEFVAFPPKDWIAEQSFWEEYERDYFYYDE